MRRFDEQVSFLITSCDLYDQGFRSEARRLALALRLLVHDTRNSPSLLTLLEASSIHLLDTAAPEQPGNLLSYHGLLTLKAEATGSGGELTWRAPLGEKAPWRPYALLPLTEWLERVVHRTHEGTLTRHEIIKVVANQDGGAHVDPDLDLVYEGLVARNTAGFTNGEAEEPMNDPVLESVRQMAYEFLESVPLNRRALGFST